MASKVAIAIATAGRRDVLSESIGVIASQSCIPDELLICPAKEEDIDLNCLKGYPGNYRVLIGPTGLTLQRNRLIETTQADIIVFLDDDFLPSRDYIEKVKVLFDNFPEVVAATGKVLADGIIGPGLEYAQGIKILEDSTPDNEKFLLKKIYNGYGCNMAFRMDTIKKNKLRFDERLPLYGWLEDVDFSRQIARYGSVVSVSKLRGVHLGTKRSGRSPGRRLGYSQVSNPLYLAKKGTMTWGRAFNQITRNVLMNFVKSFNPEKWVDRRGRLIGNFLALRDAVAGKVEPEEALKF